MATQRKKPASSKSKEIAKEIKNGAKKTSSITPSKTDIDVNKAISDSEVTVPGLNGFNLSKAVEHTGELDLKKFEVKDPLNPPDSLPQATTAQYSRASAIYEKTTNAAKLYRQKYKLDNEVFGAIGDRVTAINTAISSVRTKEQAKANFINYLSDTEKVKQAAIAFDLNLATTAQQLGSSAITKEQLVTELELKATNLEKTQTQLEEAKGELAIYKEKLGKYLGSK